MDSYETPNSAATIPSVKSNVIKKIVAPGVSKRVTDEETLRKRRQRFGSDVSSDSAVPLKKKINEGVANRQIKFDVDVPKESLSKSNEDYLNTLKKRRERFGEVTSTLLKKIEEREKALKRKARFTPHIERTIENDGKEKISENTNNSSTVEQVNKKRTYKKITFENS